MKFHWQNTVDGPTTLVEFIVANSNISKTAAKKTLNFGGGWVKPAKGGKLKRVRRASKPLKKGDVVAFYYDDQLLGLNPPTPTALLQTPHWGIWYKPVNTPSQATPYGDLTCMEYLVGKQVPEHAVHLVHRLDREVAGLMLFAYSNRAAAQLSELWQQGGVRKFYQAWIQGEPQLANGQINQPLDGKPALTLYQVHKVLPFPGEAMPCAQVDIEIKTGRLHQIRRHCSSMGHPILGDPRYNSEKRDGEALQLVASRLLFNCPLSSTPVDIQLPAELCLY